LYPFRFTKLKLSNIPFGHLTIFNRFGFITFALMSELLTKDSTALSLLFDEELYLIKAKPSMPSFAQAMEEKQELAPAFDYLGENNRFFLLLLEAPGVKHLLEAHLEVLSKILQAKGLELKDVAILNLTHYPDANFRVLKDFFSCSKVCLFGIPPNQLSLPDFPSNEPGDFEGTKVLTTFSLSELIQTQHKKVAFWNAMKNF